jgi:hypothetical protein
MRTQDQISNASYGRNDRACIGSQLLGQSIRSSSVLPDRRVPLYASNSPFNSRPFSFLLPLAKLRAAAPRALSRFLSCCTPGLFRWCNTNVVARLLILRFIPGMVPAIKAASKLCAWNTRHAPENFLSEISVAQLGKGKGFGPPRCIPTRAPRAAVETVPVSTPFGLIGATAFRSWTVRP